MLQQSAEREEEVPKGIRMAVEDYLRGAYDGDRQRLERAFHPECHIVGFLGGKYLDEAAPDFIGRLVDEESEAAGGHAYDKRILDARWTDDTAAVTAENLVRDWRAIDYLLLMQIDGRWVIRNKIYTAVNR